MILALEKNLMPRSWINALDRWAKRGMHWPFVFDPVAGQPSVTLMFFYIGYMLAASVMLVSSILLLVKGDYLQATFMPTMLALMSFVFYRLRKLDTVKFDLDDQEIELSSNNDEESEGNSNV